jgi:mRNA-degrading endonuclease toxin of MazEF toxin-antitoxin module
MAVSQGEIVELNYELPNGTLKTHPAIVISKSAVYEAEDIFYALMISSKPLPDEFSYPLTNEMLSKPLPKKSYVKCQLIQSYTEEEIIRRYGRIKPKYLQEIKEILMNEVF